MKRYAIAAAALLFGTSALAWAPSGDGPYLAQDNAEAVGAIPVAKADKAKLAPKAYDSWDDPQPMAAGGDPDLDLAVDPDTVDDGEAADTGAADTSETGMGGPIETADAAAPLATAAADLAPRPAAQNYPACRPGPGDDNCIQLYEPGVEVALAAWTQPTGGLMDESATAMGGPYEPVADAAEEVAAADAYAGDGIVSSGEPEDAEA